MSRGGASREVDQVRTANDLQKQNHLITECLNVQLIQNNNNNNNNNVTFVKR